MMKEKKSKLKILKKRVRKSTLFFLALAFITNAFAWFIYSNKVDNSITMGVKSWKVTFEQNGTDLRDNVVFNIDNIYPGMTDYNNSIDITNSGQTSAKITYELTYVKIFTDEYTNANYTSDQLIDMLKNNYPFKLTFSVDNPIITNNQTGKFLVNLTWPFESGNDALDTYWGKKSSSFKDTNPNDQEITIKATIIASQNN